MGPLFFIRDKIIAYNEKHVLSRHNHTKEIVSQDLVIGRLIPGSNPGTLFSPIVAPQRLHIGFIFFAIKTLNIMNRKDKSWKPHIFIM